MSIHEDVIAVSTGRPVPPEPKPEVPRDNRNHPGPDLAWKKKKAAA